MIFAMLALVSLVAAVVTGALGYGYSSISVPIALLVITNRVLNPALVLVEVGVNGYAALLNRHAIRNVWRRVVVIVIGIVPGVALGSWCLTGLAPTTVKLVVFVALLPLILLQAAGIRIPIRRENAAALPFGLGVGILYSLTTISGPPLALFFNNQGLTKHEFRVALAVTRLAESGLTLVAYLALGLITTQSAHLALWLVPGVLIGMPIGNVLIKKIAPETFRRVCMSFDVWLVGFGLARILPGPGGYLVFATAVLIDAVLLVRYFSPAIPEGNS